MYGTDHDYANSRLVETIVRLESEPVYVWGVRVGMKVDYSTLTEMDAMKRCDLEELNLKPVPLGYCNYNKYACYLTRMPMRRDWRQGLRRGNFTSLSGADANRIPYEALRQCILGEYPTFEAALEASKKVKSIAWHRHWAVDNNGQILHKGGQRPVGTVTNGKIVLLSKYQYLKEALEESL
ncbi:hypothetical protein D3C86_924010 [compost metagenome]